MVVCFIPYIIKYKHDRIGDCFLSIHIDTILLPQNSNCYAAEDNNMCFKVILKTTKSDKIKLINQTIIKQLLFNYLHFVF